jgi:cytochrome c5
MQANFIRVITVLWALAAAMLPGVLAIADAPMAAAAVVAPASHVEALGGTGCARVHDAECAVCSTLRLAGSAPGRGGLATWSVARPCSIPDARRTHIAAADRRDDGRPRAPPAL